MERRRGRREERMTLRRRRNIGRHASGEGREEGIRIWRRKKKKNKNR